MHQGHEGFSGQSRWKQCSFMSLSALLTAQTITVIEWSSTTIDNALVQGDNMYLNIFNNDLIPRQGFLSLNNLPTVVCCRQVLRLFMSTGLRFCALFMSIFALFPVYMSTGLCNYGVMFFYVVIFSPEVYSILMYILWLAICKTIFDINHAFYSHNKSCMDLTNLRVRNYIWQIHSNKTVKNIHN